VGGDAAPRRSLPWRTTVALGLRHGRRLASDVVELGSARRLWWFTPVLVAVLLVAVAIVFSQTALPVAVYTLF
jgi:hypothetical protein